MGQLSLNSVTDEYYIAACNETEQSLAVRKQMIRYLSRVSDKNKPLFMFNQKLKVGRSEESDGEGCGTPRFSVVSFVFQWRQFWLLLILTNQRKKNVLAHFLEAHHGGPRLPRKTHSWLAAPRQLHDWLDRFPLILQLDVLNDYPSTHRCAKEKRVNALYLMLFAKLI